MAAIEARLKEELGGELPGGHSVGWSMTDAPKDLRKAHNPGESQAWGGQPSQRPPEQRPESPPPHCQASALWSE